MRGNTHFAGTFNQIIKFIEAYACNHYPNGFMTEQLRRKG